MNGCIGFFLPPRLPLLIAVSSEAHRITRNRNRVWKTETVIRGKSRRGPRLVFRCSLGPWPSSGRPQRALGGQQSSDPAPWMTSGTRPAFCPGGCPGRPGAGSCKLGAGRKGYRASLLRAVCLADPGVRRPRGCGRPFGAAAVHSAGRQQTLSNWQAGGGPGNVLLPGPRCRGQEPSWSRAGRLGGTAGLPRKGRPASALKGRCPQSA